MTLHRTCSPFALRPCVRQILAGATLWIVSVLAYGSEIERIETTNATLSVKSRSGDLVALKWKRPEFEIVGEARLGENFRILLPRRGYEAAYFNSRDQVLRKLEKSRDCLVMHYGPLRNEQEEVDVKVAYTICDTGSQLQFSIQVDNATKRPLAEVLYAIIGGQQGIESRVDTESLIPGSAFRNLAPKLFSQFQANTEDFGVRVPAASYAYPGSDMAMGWLDVYNRKAGIGYYYANQDPETRVTALYAELHPYVKALSADDNWPSAAGMPIDEPIGLTLGWVNFPYTVKGRFQAGPIALQVHEGDWRAGATLYRAWFEQHFEVAREPSWLRKEMAWQEITLLQPEDVILYRFKDLPRLAADAKRYGVTAMAICGWNVGGVDRGYPDYTPDPRLGTAEEFKQALTDIREMGVHPILFGKINVVDTSTKAFRSHLFRYAVEARWAPDLIVFGHGEGTIGTRAPSHGTTVHRNLAYLSPSHREFRESLIRQYLDRIQDGAEGLMFDNTQFVEFLDFNRKVPTSPDRSLPQGMLTTFQELRQRSRTINPDVGAIMWGVIDRAIPHIDMGYGGLWEKDVSSMAVLYTFPEWSSTAVAMDPEDYTHINNGLRYGLVWVMAPGHVTASMDDPLTQPLSRYVGELIRIRKQHAQLLFYGRFNDTDGATVIANHQNIRYSVFQPRDPKDEARAAVVVNFGDQDEIVELSILGKEGHQAQISIPFQSDRVSSLPVKLTLPPNYAAVVVAEQ